MCELMGLSFDQPVSADFSVRSFALRDESNADGWGLAWYPDRSLSLVKEAITWRQSGHSKFLETYSGLRSRIYIAHVRHQTTGGRPTHADSHPFQRECFGREFCFAHNGTIREFKSLPLDRFRPLGNTDSEHVFCYLMNELSWRGRALDDRDDWEWLHGRLLAINAGGTLNCLLSDGERLFCYRDRRGWKGLTMRKIRWHDRADRVFEDDTMEVTMTGDSHSHGCVVATFPLSATGWHDLSPGGLLVLHGATILCSLIPPD